VTSSAEPSRGEVWDLHFDPVSGHEQTASRPALIISEDLFNEGPAEMVVVAPITRTQRRIRWHVSMTPPEGGMGSESFIQCEEVRTVSKQRLKRRRGRVSPPVMQQVEDRLRILLGL
jgi:mRNA interferase MazF